MEIRIVMGNKEHVGQCFEMSMKTKIGEIYFSDGDFYNDLMEAIHNKEIYVALNEDNKCIGFIWVVINAVFSKYPYLQLIIIDEGFQGKGIGKKLIDYFENVVSKDYSKIFLMVSNFNTDARRLYESLGYRFIGIMPNFYIDNTDEYLMMKTKK